MANTLPIPSASDLSSPLARALEQNESVQNVVEQSAAELAVVHAVLKQELPGHLQTGDVAQALQRTDELEIVISDTAHELAQVNEVLAQEIHERVDLEHELEETKAALVEARSQLT